MKKNISYNCNSIAPVQTPFLETRLLSAKKSLRNTIVRAARLLLQKQLVVIPTETVYGLAADATSDEACEKIFIAKNRPKINPLIVHCCNMDMVNRCVRNEIPTEKKAYNYAQKILQKFSPGAITVICYASPYIAKTTRAGGDTVAIRIPSHENCLQIIKQADIPLAAPSANVSSRPSPTDVDSALQEMNNKVAAIVDGGRCQIGIESTIIDCTTSIPILIRPGDISIFDVYEALEIDVDEYYKQVDAVQNVVYPGTYFAHYKPKCRVLMREKKDFQDFTQFYENNIEEADIVLYLVVDGLQSEMQKSIPKNVEIKKYPSWKILAYNLYKDFFDAEQNGINTIIVDTPSVLEHEGLFNRITKAAYSQINSRSVNIKNSA